MKVKVIAERCQGHAMCHLSCPEVFRLSDDDGHAYVVSENVQPNLEASVDLAMRSCPEQAIEMF